jgi:hypothetical protein
MVLLSLLCQGVLFIVWSVCSVTWVIKYLCVFCIPVSTLCDNSSVFGEVNSQHHWDLPSRDSRWSVA